MAKTDTRAKVLHEIKAFLKDTATAETTFGKNSVGNPYIVRRLKQGKRIYTDTADALLAFIEKERARLKKPRPLADGHCGA